MKSRHHERFGYNQREPLLQPKRASFAKKRGKCHFSAHKSLPCRYSALSLQSETVERRGHSWTCFPEVPSLCLRSAFALGGEGRAKGCKKYELRATKLIAWLFEYFNRGSDSSINTFKHSQRSPPPLTNPTKDREVGSGLNSILITLALR